MLEENSFRGHTADFVVMFLFGSFSMIIFALFVNLLFLGKPKRINAKLPVVMFSNIKWTKLVMYIY